MRWSIQPVLAFYLLLVTSPVFSQSCSNTASDSPSVAEEPSQSIAELARANKNKKIKAKNVVTDDDLNLERGPIPSLRVEGLDNSDEIIRAIKAFAHEHTPTQTESIVHDWFDRYDHLMETAMRENVELRELLQSNNYNGYTICQERRDYQSCVLRREAETRSAHQDQINMQNNGRLIARIQQAFIRIRPAIAAVGLNYDWFKIRNADDNGSF